MQTRAKPLVSYAQRGEDVVLLNALSDVKRGFYVDVGAHDPVTDSVTHLFYQRGWRGINIEPEPAAFRRLAAARPRDVNLNIAVAAESGRRPFYVIEGTGLSTLYAEQAAQHEGLGFGPIKREISARRLIDVCREHAERDIHFLKIDVEGAEAEVIAGADLSTFRPWVILVEAVRPLTQTPSYAAWEPAITSAGYTFALADGLNRWYVAVEHNARATSLTKTPTNFVRSADKVETVRGPMRTLKRFMRALRIFEMPVRKAKKWVRSSPKVGLKTPKRTSVSMHTTL